MAERLFAVLGFRAKPENQAQEKTKYLAAAGKRWLRMPVNGMNGAGGSNRAPRGL
jgi:hypothetical protein